ncbi:hypothetical protein DOTSEDRAFT_75990 [Dothistroma septosporum NZE10]|uniref:F-box domain-containing protein n=1 Tax=Dothistroma septosporum (strain NZE10 / CBS 128990) TaxID=675120 RepID=M2YI24_DOTSN|nr:hypothetical protein DOTSEDRAFT_75990 [Dothistroma septosporum NZE10]
MYLPALCATMTSILQILPSELLARIFAFLPQRRDVSQARLVCKPFHELSSPFLITEVIFAPRLDTLKRCREVIDHPYFSRYVTHLIYDSSRYDEDLGTDWNSYVSRCHASPRDMIDEDWRRRQRDDKELLDELSNPSARGHGRAPDADVEGDADAMGIERYYEQVYRMGCQRHFPDYYSRYKNQQALQQRHIPHSMIKRAFTACPKLRNIVYTDHRGLARAGESYDSCCRRLFGLTLEPDHAGTSHTSWHQLFDIFELAHEVGARIDSFHVGSHPFMSTQSVIGSELDSAEAPLMLPLTYMGRRRGETLKVMRESFSRLDTLYLSYEDDVAPNPGGATLVRLLESAAQNVKHLSLVRAIDRGRVDYDPNAIGGCTNELDSLSIRCPHLRYLELRHLQLPHVQPLQDFLAAHASTLREVRLVEYCLTDRANEQEKLARWAGENMHLMGVEVVTAADLQALTAPTKPATRSRTSTSSRDLAVAEKALLEIESRERIWLGGRRNMLNRTVELADRARFATDPADWWLRIVRS